MRHLLRAGTVLGASLLLLATTAADGLGQTPADRAALEAFRDTLARISAVDPLNRLDGVRANTPVLMIRAGLIDLRRAEITGSRSDFDEATRAIEDAVYKEDDWPWPWYALALVRMAESRRGVVVKETRYLGQGISYRRGAMDAFGRALETDPTFVPAAEGLAGLVTAMGHRLLSLDFLPPIVKATKSPGMPPEIWLAKFRLDFCARDYETSLDDLGAYLRIGGDTGMARVEQARTLTALGPCTRTI